MEMARQLLDQFGLGDNATRSPMNLAREKGSGSPLQERLRATLRFFLADEPTASLDAQAGRNICQILRNQVDEHGRTVVVVSHDPAGGNSPIAQSLYVNGQVEQEEKDL